MSNITVSQEDCTKCGVCVKVCPVSIISMKENKLPMIAKDLEDKCVRCGHCEVFCLFNALETNFEGEYPLSMNQRAPDIKPDQLAKFVQTRRSIRHYRKKPLKRALIEQMLDVIRYSPTAANSQRVKWIVVHDPEKVQKIAAHTVEWMKTEVEKRPNHPYSLQYNGIIRRAGLGEDAVCHNAPHLLIAMIPKGSTWTKADPIIALSYFELVAKGYGIASCWNGFLKIAMEEYPPMREELEIPEGYMPSYALTFGYPKQRSTGAAPKRNPLSIKWI
ncbi:nitroreductase family protein [Methanogenium organophilum]|uniref:Nitroreductase family protein n=1 Tax=Methanogenium organophilum TaxID=2199 RepID=A0A9X9S263_METOG|nr:nitroreductase family protein [Methanogenium organophilum]WAI00469.1 nitroreductase family protein [Methanogenium organophilum]